MAFPENLQYLRARDGLTQEQLAERLGVSRQSVSKWESGTSFPEMDKLLELCDLFSCNLDGLLRGDLAAAGAGDAAGYDAHMNWFSKIIPAGIGCILGGLALSQVLEGAGVEELLSDAVFFLALIPGVLLLIVGGMQHSRFVSKHPHIEPFYSEAQEESWQRRFVVWVAAGVGVILCGVLVNMVSQALPLPPDGNGDLYDGILLAAVALGVSALAHAGIQKSKYNIPAYNEARQQTASPETKENPLVGKLCGMIMMIAVLLFLGSLFLFEWEKSWVVFPLGGVLCAIVSIALDKNN